MDDEDDDDAPHPDKAKFLELLEGIDFADRYYAYCQKHEKRGPAIPAPTQIEALAATGYTFSYEKREKFHAWLDVRGGNECELGVNVALDKGDCEWILVFRTPSGHLGGPFSGLALDVKRRTDPQYRHTPPYPTPNIANKRDLLDTLDEGLALYETIAEKIAATTWK